MTLVSHFVPAAENSDSAVVRLIAQGLGRPAPVRASAPLEPCCRDMARLWTARESRQPRDA
jgi:hypothetical protein